MLIVLLGAGNGLINAFIFDAGNVATNTMMVGPGRTSKPYGGYQQNRRVQMKESDMDILKTGTFADKVDMMSTSISKGGYTMNYGKRYFKDISINATTPGDIVMNKVEMLEGRFINETDIKMARKVVILPHLIAKNFLMGSTDYERLLGQRVKVGNMSFQVIGVRHGAENENDTQLYVPYTTFKTLFGLADVVDQITFSFHGLSTKEENEEFEKQLKTALNTAHGAAPDDESATWIWNRFTDNMEMEKGANIIRTALWIIGLFTLISGIVGVSNIMLITVKERTHEFGIRKAIGAKPWNITKLILAESISITAVFGYIGMILGLVACEILNATVGQSSMEIFGQSIQLLKNPTVGVSTAVGATIVLIVAGTVAGLFPAHKASKVKPIEALMAN
jgi:ABC-type antimicrobial peptide transport system, permease component